MAEEMTYEKTIELEENIRLKNKADEIYNDFMAKVKLSVNQYKKGRFTLWSDSYNATYLKVNDSGDFVFQCEFLHESYALSVTPSAIFDCLKRKYTGLDHLVAHINMLKIDN